jgi:hypothetical protein
VNTLGEVMEFGFMFDHSEIPYNVVDVQLPCSHRN